MKALIVYSSQTENTKKLADTVYETLGTETSIFHVDEAPKPEGYDMVAVGFWLQGGKPDPKASKYLSEIQMDQKVFLFATHGALAGSDHVNQAMEQARIMLGGATVTGTFTCQGEVNPKVLEKVRQKAEPPVWIDDADKAIGHPDASDLSALKQALQSVL